MAGYWITGKVMPMDLGLKGKTALVTGATGEIGTATARRLAEEGAAVLVGYHTDEEGAASLAADIEAGGGTARPVPTPLAGPVTDLTNVDVLVSNAVQWPHFEDDRDLMTAALATNIAGTFALVEEVLPGMRERGWGRIVVISTDIVVQPMPSGVTYPSIKGALEAGARVLAVREARYGVLTNVVRPGFTLSDRARAMAGAVESESARTPTGRICTPLDVAAVVAFLGSAAHSHVNGETISVSGGRELTR
jgi:NAD(P)-dependent dehydrogenase (short-subunit alcohol dehydrogenase family)